MKLLKRVRSLPMSSSMQSRIAENIVAVRHNWEHRREYLTCYFCRVRQPDLRDLMKVPMHRLIDRSFNRVRYQSVDIGVPRCGHCHRIHLTIATLLWAGGVVGFTVGAVVMNMVAGAATADSTPSQMYLVLAVAAGVGELLGCLAALHVAGRERIRSLGARKRFSLVKNFMRQGWKLGAAPKI